MPCLHTMTDSGSYVSLTQEIGSCLFTYINPPHDHPSSTGYKIMESDNVPGAMTYD